MPLEAFPTEPKEQFLFLVGQAEKYIRLDDVAPRAFRVWRNRALEWFYETNLVWTAP
jgi:hypothetical protein